MLVEEKRSNVQGQPYSWSGCNGRGLPLSSYGLQLDRGLPPPSLSRPTFLPIIPGRLVSLRGFKLSCEGRGIGFKQVVVLVVGWFPFFLV